jgi:MFS family permease
MQYSKHHQATLRRRCIKSRVAATPCTKAQVRWILAATILGSSLVFIDGTVVNVALPALQTNLNATVVDVQWVVEAYALFLAALLLAGGALGDHFGRKRIYAIGVALFTMASIWRGLAPDINQWGNNCRTKDEILQAFSSPLFPSSREKALSVAPYIPK